MLSILSCVCWQSVYLLWRNVYLGLLPTFGLGCLFFGFFWVFFFNCSMACGIFPDQGSNLCPLHWQADSQPVHHQGSPVCFFDIEPHELLIYFGDLSLVGRIICKYILSFCGLSFHFVYGFLFSTKAFKFN